MKVLRVFRQKPDIPSEISLYRDIREKEIYIFTDAGRVCRPLLVVENNRLKLRRSHVEMLREASHEKVSENVHVYLHGFTYLRRASPTRGSNSWSAA